MTDLIDNHGYRANVGIVLMNGRNELFLGGRTGGRGWQFPQGGIQRDEGLIDALFRELTEEIGLGRDDVTVLGSTANWMHYRLPDRFVRHGSQPLCIGQKQRWFLLRMSAGEERIRFDTTDQPEFERWRWVDYWVPVKEVIYFKRRVYARALEELGRLAFPEGLPAFPEWWEGRRESGSERAAAGAASESGANG